jgi:predicted permease
VAVIGHEHWQNRFGGAADIIGRTFVLASKTYQIIGVMPPGFGLRMIDQAADTQFYALIQKDEPAYSAGGAGPMAAIGRLKPGISLQAAQAELAAIQRGLDERHPDNPKGFTVLLTNLQKDNTRNVHASLWLSAAALGFVLLIVCANVGSLLLGRTLQRQREMAIRSALGSGRRRIVRQLLTESGIVATLGGVAGLLLAHGAIQIFRAVNPFGRMPPNPIGIDWRTLTFTLLVGIASTLVFGVAPALEGANADLNEALKASARGIAGKVGALRSRALLVSVQVALSFVLVVGAGLMIETLARLESQPLGMRVHDVTVASVEIPKERRNDVRPVHRGRVDPGVEQSFRQVESARSRLLLQRLGGADEFVAAVIRIGDREKFFDARAHVVGVEDGELTVAPKAGDAVDRDVRVRAHERDEMRREDAHGTDRLRTG